MRTTAGSPRRKASRSRRSESGTGCPVSRPLDDGDVHWNACLGDRITEGRAKAGVKGRFSHLPFTLTRQQRRLVGSVLRPDYPLCRYIPSDFPEAGFPLRNATLKTGGTLLSRYSSNYGNLISRRRSEQALRAAAAETAFASRTKSEFIANMSHELRTPLNAIIGFSELIQSQGAKGQASPTICDYAGDVSRAGHLLLGIVSDILDMSKIESGNFELDWSPNSIAEAIEAALLFVKDRLEAKGQSLSLHIANGIPAFEFDRRRIIQVVLNLLTNAHKFTPANGKITVSASLERGFVAVAVGDSGIGMSPEQLDYALKPFAQVKSAYSRGHDGTGLGLPLAKALVEHHGGILAVSSEPQVGTRVLFSLPIDRRHRAAAESIPASSDRLWQKDPNR
jgi:two-component system cell cycle sensor histidine kinase PleC